MNYHSHKYRNEIWIIVSGTGKTNIDGIVKNVKAGDIVNIFSGCKHTIMAISKLNLIEIQLGTNISVYDKQKYDLK